jgi:ubiquinone/menaquinone biosynthesis C-methylase UbiE
MEKLSELFAVPRTDINFDDTAYLSANPDVAEALDRGQILSSWSHYVECGFSEHRKGVSDLTNAAITSLFNHSYPTPPERLISRVHGSSDSQTFQKVGKRIALDICRYSASIVDFNRPLGILDFGTGCGRILAPMMSLANQARFTATDIDPEAITWCKEHYTCSSDGGRVQFSINADLPPLALSKDSFDFVYAISVFTHLPRDMGQAWLGELARIIRPDGVLAISVANDRLIRSHLNSEERARLDKEGFYYHPYGSTDGLPEYYQAAWHTREYIERRWTEHFQIIKYIPWGIADHQDLILCRRNSSS